MGRRAAGVDDPEPPAAAARRRPARGPGGFAEWVRPHLPAMARLAARLAPAADRDDVVQEALVRAWTKRRLYDAGPRHRGRLAARDHRRPGRQGAPAGRRRRAGVAAPGRRRRRPDRPGPGPRRGRAARPAAAGRRLLLLRGPDRRRDGRGDGLRRGHRQVHALRRPRPPPPAPGGLAMTDADRTRPAARRGRRALARRPARRARARPRAARPAAPAPLAAARRGGRGGRRRRGGVAAVAVSRRAADSPAAGTGPPARPPAPPTTIVRDGDRVAGQGSVLALPGPPGPALRAAGRPTVASPGPPPCPQPCPNALTVTGLDLDRLSDRKERDGAVWGRARVEGVYRARTLTVTRQEAYVSDRKDRVTAADPVPCPEPAGGWPRPPADSRAALPPAQQRDQPAPPTSSTSSTSPTRTAGTCRTSRTARAPRSTSSARPATSRRPGRCWSGSSRPSTSASGRRGARRRWRRRCTSCRPAGGRRGCTSPPATGRHQRPDHGPDAGAGRGGGRFLRRRGRRPGRAGADAAQGALTLRPRRRSGTIIGRRR